MQKEKANSINPGTIRIAVKVFFFISGFIFATWASRIPAMQNRLHLNDAQLGTLLFALPAGIMTSMPLAAFLISKFNSRNIMLTGVFLYLTLLCSIGLAENFWEMASILFIFGASRNLYNISINTQSVGVQNLYSKSIIASFHGIWSISGFTGATLATLMISLNVSPFRHFLIVSIIVLILVLFAWPNTLKINTGYEAKKAVFSWPDKSLLKLGLIAFCSMICEGILSDWSGIYFLRELHAPKSLVTVGYLAYLSSMATGRFLGDWIINRFGSIRLLTTSVSLIISGAAVIMFFPYMIAATIGFMLSGFGVSCIMPFVFSNATKVSKLPTSSAIAAVSTVGYLGFLTGPPLMGYMAHFAGLRHSFLLPLTAGIVILIILKKLPLKDEPRTSGIAEKSIQ